ncbi:uncharacterized protein LOC131151283 [Malania oleifera]|uniref:uncharacterized protein LOC131151283 n=1 Tax=Malania oleifera TaxID=397392 RepID=UPI0025ADE518|nr:uncharacterized protein LOC131151283 [Malania oleifera]
MKDNQSITNKIREIMKSYEDKIRSLSREEDTQTSQVKSSMLGRYTAKDYEDAQEQEVQSALRDIDETKVLSDITNDIQNAQDELDKLLHREKWTENEVSEIQKRFNKRLNEVEDLKAKKLASAEKILTRTSKGLARGGTAGAGPSGFRETIPVSFPKVSSWDAKPVWQPLRMEPHPWERKKLSFKEMLQTTAKYQESVLNYPGRIQEEFRPRTSVLEGVPQNGTILRLNCEKDPTVAIDDWAMDIRYHILSRGIESCSVEQAYKFAVATIRGNAGDFWEILQRNSDVSTIIINTIKTPDEVIAIIADFLKQEFVGYSLVDRGVELVEKARMALTKIQICDMCYFEEFLCEYQYWYYKLGPQDQVYAKEVFINKLPGSWPEVVKQAVKQRLERDTKVSDTLGVRAETLRQMIRLYCM